MAEQFGSFTASELYCPKCRVAQPVREKLLLVLPSGELHEYLCRQCGTSLGERKVSAGKAVAQTSSPANAAFVALIIFWKVSMDSLRIIFMGTAELACASLDALAKSSSVEVVAVVTQPDKPKGRDLKLQPSAVKQLALKLNLPVLQPEKARAQSFIATVGDLKPDLIVVVAYGQILPQTILDLPRFGCLNVHTSLLPKYRGAAPIQWAILDDESETGVTIMKMDAGLDTGDILSQRATPILSGDNAETLHNRLALLGAELLTETIPNFVAGKIVPRKQPEDSSYARKISKEDGRLDWSNPARKLWNQIRAFTPWPGAFTFQSSEEKPRLLKIWQTEIVETVSAEPGKVLQADKNGIVVGCGENALRIMSLQREGGRRLSAHEFLTGHPIQPGEKLG